MRGASEVCLPEDETTLASLWVRQLISMSLELSQDFALSRRRRRQTQSAIDAALCVCSVRCSCQEGEVGDRKRGGDTFAPQQRFGCERITKAANDLLCDIRR